MIDNFRFCLLFLINGLTRTVNTGQTEVTNIRQNDGKIRKNTLKRSINEIKIRIGSIDTEHQKH